MFCTNCGKEYVEGQKFCSGCGALLEGDFPLKNISDKNREKKLNILKKYLPECVKTIDCFVGNDIPVDKCKNAINTYAKGVNPSDVLALTDESFRCNGKAGILFTVNDVYINHLNKDLPLKHMKYSEGVKYNKEFTGRFMLHNFYDIEKLNEIFLALYTIDRE